MTNHIVAPPSPRVDIDLSDEIQARSQTSSHMPELDGVRGIAILLVLFTHLGAIVRSAGVFSVVTREGWVGVDLFFVLSGFLITRILIATREDRQYYRRFYIRRALRIWPLYFLYVLVIYSGLHILVHIDAVQRFAATSQVLRDNLLHLSQPLIVYFLFVQNLTNFGDMLGVTWSLCVEEHFYLIWPLLVRKFSIAVLKKILWIGFFLQPLLRLAYVFFAQSRHVTYATYYEVIYHRTYFHLDAIIAGCLLGLYWIEWKQPERQRSRFWAMVIAGIAASVVCIVLTRQYNTLGSCLAYTTLSILFAGAIGLVLLGWNRPFFLNRRLRYMGKISYGFYLIHFPIIAVFQSHAVLAKLFPFHSVLLSELAGAICATAISLAIAAASWNWLEKPALSLKSRLAP